MQSETYYHIYNHANGSENLFREEKNYRYFLSQWAKYITPIADTYAYCLMPNHIHFLIRVRVEEEILNHQGFQNLDGFERSKKLISQQFSNLFNSYTKAFNKMYGRRGSLFIPNFKRKEIDSNEYLTEIIRYIHSNAVHHQFVSQMEPWPWSSYNSILSDRPTPVRRAEVLEWFGGIPSFLAAHAEQDVLKNDEL